MKKIIYKPTGYVMEFKWRTFHAYFDGGHGWLKVPYTALYRLGLLDKITDFSYVSKHQDYVFLEEDYDASIFIRTLKDIGCPYKIISHYSEKPSRIRSYNGFCEALRTKVDVEFR